MLKLKDVEKPMNHSIEFDIYVPVKIKVGHWDMLKEHTIYWRTGDFEKSLLEIGLGSETGILRSFTLTDAALVERNHHCSGFDNCEIMEGTPLLDINDFPSSGFVDVNNQFKVLLGQKEVLILISMSSCIKRIKHGRVQFGFDSNNELISARITDITNEEMDTLKQGLQFE